MMFQSPSVLWFLVFLVPALLFSILSFRKRLQGYISLVGHGASGGSEANSFTALLSRRYVISSSCFLLCCACLIIALAGPQWGYRLVSKYHRGVDVVLALDLSRSMEVRDIGISRLNRALDLAGRICDSLPGIRFAVALGKGSGILAIPLTEDLESIQALLDGISSSSMSSQGTNLERLLDAAAEAFLDTFPTRRRIVLLSDGETLSGSLAAAADRAHEAGISIISIGIGTEGGMPVPLASDQDEYLRRPDGSVVISSLRRDTLQNAANRSEGLYIDGSRADAVDLVVEHMVSLSTVGAVEAYGKEMKSRTSYFILLALGLLALSKLAEHSIGGRR